MTKNIKDIMKDLTTINKSIQKLLKESEYETYNDLSGVDIDYSSAEELFLLDEARAILDKLYDVSRNLNYLKRPIISEGFLHKNNNDRYELNGLEITSGQVLEYLATDDWHMAYDSNGDYAIVPYWCYGVLEHNGTDYYIVGANIELEGLQVRIRK